MSTFIEIKNNEGKRRFVNTRHIEEIIENENGCTIYFAFNVPDAIEQDYIATKMSYDEIVSMILKGGAE